MKSGPTVVAAATLLCLVEGQPVLQDDDGFSWGWETTLCAGVLGGLVVAGVLLICRKKRKNQRKAQIQVSEVPTNTQLEEPLVTQESCIVNPLKTDPVFIPNTVPQLVQESRSSTVASILDDQSVVPTSYADSFANSEKSLSIRSSSGCLSFHQEALALQKQQELILHEERQLAHCARELQSLLNQRRRSPSPPLVLPPSELPVSSVDSEPIRGYDPQGRLVPLE
eukprot:TRINITY_DN1211_c3_g1_i2.p1 TRINITY_DN1211_c3_g1~~TRINITY_DN1211_c3_g1_i2.p1  ORF type:complete len:248 (+),score=34.86 TRINITY_DN1211_c3_g1_i2:72-746(+)